ncbi:tRNA pseudouridine38-40 synthase [Acetoanaerobium pronyense]|uniref:tRNA pseudouridine synthase A n=1 Tax=Acetoanaerobium pronyense TaxID=1482736 RepID=A0ABS4KKB2_9FIRM|nr:tRNA pseudouridine(38-40) synthase TruA [Acetoanaerobium pronyense]MBP2027571.1 tRNA pseudouridine38-40 synthase [Acetoanaerobium pronyense]
MKNIRLELQYDGSRYLGWQRLNEKDITIQGKMEDMLSLMSNEKTNVIGCSRTDKGVHAKGYVCNFITNSELSPKEIIDYSNKYLPEDIRVIKASEASERFHARYNAKSKLYRYTIDNNKYADVFSRKYSSHIPESLDIELMKIASKNFIGTHDFEGFTTMKSKKKNCVRTISDIQISQQNNFIFIDYTGDGFLHNMIRIITGTLLRAARKDLSPQEITNILTTKDRSIAGPMVESKGLALIKVSY